jgi:hypothetical protein
MNETAIEIGGKSRILKGTFQNLNDIEKALDCSIMAFITPYVRERLFQPTFKQAAAIIYHGLNGNDANRLQLNSVEAEIAENGLGEYLPTLIEFLIGSISGSKKKPVTEAENSPTV